MNNTYIFLCQPLCCHSLVIHFIVYQIFSATWYCLCTDNKIIPKKSKLTTAVLQMSEVCTLVVTLPKWTVVDRVGSCCNSSIIRLFYILHSTGNFHFKNEIWFRQIYMFIYIRWCYKTFLCEIRVFFSHLQAIFSLKSFDKKHVFGKGNLEEIGRRIRCNVGVTAAVVGIDMLSGVQLASLQDAWGVAVYDRYFKTLHTFWFVEVFPGTHLAWKKQII